MIKKINSSYIIKSGIDNMNFNRIQKMLSNSYWVEGITKKEIINGAKNSALNVGTFNIINEQVGYSRVISDKTRFAYIYT